MDMEDPDSCDSQLSYFGGSCSLKGSVSTPLVYIRKRTKSGRYKQHHVLRKVASCSRLAITAKDSLTLQLQHAHRLTWERCSDVQQPWVTSEQVSDNISEGVSVAESKTVSESPSVVCTQFLTAKNSLDLYTAADKSPNRHQANGGEGLDGPGERMQELIESGLQYYMHHRWPQPGSSISRETLTHMTPQDQWLATYCAMRDFLKDQLNQQQQTKQATPTTLSPAHINTRTGPGSQQHSPPVVIIKPVLHRSSHVGDESKYRKSRSVVTWPEQVVQEVGEGHYSVPGYPGALLEGLLAKSVDNIVARLGIEKDTASFNVQTEMTSKSRSRTIINILVILGLIILLILAVIVFLKVFNAF